MRLRIAVPLLLLLTVVVAGAAGTWVLCEQGFCGDDASVSNLASADQVDEIRTPTTFGAGETNSEVTPIATLEFRDLPPLQRLCGPTSIEGLAIISDSWADEYRAESLRGGEFGETTFNWAELLARERGIDLGPWGTRPEPRRSGYEYNWALSGETSFGMLESGQHTGVAQQIEEGKVSHVIVQIGINDFNTNDLGIRIYQGELTGTALEQQLNEIAANLALAVQTVQVAGADGVLLVALKDYLAMDLVPEADITVPDREGRQRLVAAYGDLNERLAEIARQEGVTFFEINDAMRHELEDRYDPSSRQFILVGGEAIDLGTRGNEPHHGLLDDQFLHPGTVLSGLLANLYIEKMNESFHTEFSLLSDEEILRIAGIQIP